MVAAGIHPTAKSDARSRVRFAQSAAMIRAITHKLKKLTTGDKEVTEAEVTSSVFSVFPVVKRLSVAFATNLQAPCAGSGPPDV